MKQPALPVVKSAIRAIDVLEYIARASKSPTFAEIGTELGIPNSSLFYLLSTLSQRGYLRQEGAKGGYALGPALVVLAESASKVPWAQLVEPLVELVWSETRETTSYFERRGDEMECLLSRLAQHSLIPVHRIGQRSPMYIFSGGKIFLADMSKQELDSYLDRTPLVKMTEHTLSTPAAVRREIAKVRESGVAVTVQEHTLGTVGISVGLRSSVGLIGTLGVVIPAVRFDDDVLKQVMRVLKEAAHRFGLHSGLQNGGEEPAPERQANAKARGTRVIKA